MPDKSLVIVVVVLAICFCLVDVACDQIRLRRQERQERAERERRVHELMGDGMDSPDR